jgi:hypothetical protein
MSKIIECQVNDEYILGSGVVIGAAGSYGDVILRLKFNDTWAGLNISATFIDALGQSEAWITITPSMEVMGAFMVYDVPIPQAALAVAGRAKLTLSGFSVYKVEEDGEVSYKKDSLTNTATAYFRVLESNAVIVTNDGVDPSIPEIVLALVNEAEASADAASRALGETEDQKELAEEAANKAKDEAQNALGHANDAKFASDVAAGHAKSAASSAAEVEGMLGDLDAALDGIIAIQEELMGGAGV